MGRKDLKVQLVSKVPKDKVEYKVPKDDRENLDHQDPKACKDLLVNLANEEKEERQVQLVHLDPLVHKGQEVQLEQEANLDLLVLLVDQGQREKLVVLVHLDLMGQVDQPVHQAQAAKQVPKDQEVKLAREEKLVSVDQLVRFREERKVDVCIKTCNFAF